VGKANGPRERARGRAHHPEHQKKMVGTLRIRENPRENPPPSLTTSLHAGFRGAARRDVVGRFDIDGGAKRRLT
jgi:hypothetical protein